MSDEEPLFTEQTVRDLIVATRQRGAGIDKIYFSDVEGQAAVIVLVGPVERTGPAIEALQREWFPELRAHSER